MANARVFNFRGLIFGHVFVRLNAVFCAMQKFVTCLMKYIKRTFP